MAAPPASNADHSPGQTLGRVRSHQCVHGLAPSATALIPDARPAPRHQLFPARQRSGHRCENSLGEEAGASGSGARIAPGADVSGMLAERGSPIGSTDGSRCQRCSLASPTSPCGPRLCRSECSSWLRIMRNQEERLENHRDPRYALTSPRTPSGSNVEDPSPPRGDPGSGEHVRADPVPGLPPLPPGIRETSGFRRKAFVHWRCLHENPRGIAHAAALDDVLSTTIDLHESLDPMAQRPGAGQPLLLSPGLVFHPLLERIKCRGGDAPRAPALDPGERASPSQEAGNGAPSSGHSSDTTRQPGRESMINARA